MGRPAEVPAMAPFASDRYPPALIALHWVTLLLLAGVYACIELRELYPRGSDARELLKFWHYLLGLTVFTLTWLRLALRLNGHAPPISPAPPAWQAALAHATVLLLYLLMLAAPMLGYLLLNAEGTTITIADMTMPALIAENPALAERLEELHETVATLGYFVIGLHAFAGLYHHYFLRDNALRRMMLRN